MVRFEQVAYLSGQVIFSQLVQWDRCLKKLMLRCQIDAHVHRYENAISLKSWKDKILVIKFDTKILILRTQVKIKSTSNNSSALSLLLGSLLRQRNKKSPNFLDLQYKETFLVNKCYELSYLTDI